jgi:hypothetical protein
MAINFGKLAEAYRKRRLRTDCSQAGIKFGIKAPWECTDCLDSGVAGRGTRQTFCHCKAGKELILESYNNAADGLDSEVVRKEFSVLHKKLT